MKFENSDGDMFEIQITGYQYPEITDDEYDSNWLNIRVAASNIEGRWTATDPCLLTWEIEKLAGWLAKMRKRGEVEQALEFMEPCLKFSFIRSRQEPAIRVSFDFELLPPWKRDSAEFNVESWLDFPVEQLNLDDAVTSLDEQLGHFPERSHVID